MPESGEIESLRSEVASLRAALREKDAWLFDLARLVLDEFPTDDLAEIISTYAAGAMVTASEAEAAVARLLATGASHQETGGPRAIAERDEP